MEGKTKEVVEVVYDKVAYESWCVTKKNGVCVDHLHRCKTSFCLFCVLVNNFLAIYAGGQ